MTEIHQLDIPEIIAQKTSLNTCVWNNPAYLFLEHIEVVNDNTNEEIKGEEWPHDDEENKKCIWPRIGVPRGLLVHLENNIPWAS